MKKTILLTATSLGLISIIIGAFGSHGLQDYLISIEKVDAFEVSVRYQFYHVFFLLTLGLSYDLFNQVFIKYAFFACLLGILLFSGSLYVLCLTNNSFFGIITPFGGISLIIAWACFFISIIRSK
tara:strand:- start:2406 stop:2780 length:375 start_codon:yes stop_codon:yes gene_type:complete